MFTSGIKFVNFKKKFKAKKILNLLSNLNNESNQIIESLSNQYVDSFDKNFTNKKKTSNFRLIGMGGSTLGSQAIYQFLKHKVRKKFDFIDNLQTHKYLNKKKYTNLIISKSGNTIETIVNANILLKKKDKNIFITENKKNYLYTLAKELKADLIHHNNFIKDVILFYPRFMSS